MKKWIWIIAVVTVAVVTLAALNGYFMESSTQSNTDGAETVEVVIDTLTGSIGATGKVRANQTAYLTWDVSGEVEQVNVQVGDEVKDGQLLASLEQNSLTQSVILAQADLVSAQQALEDLLYSRNQQAQALLAVEDAEGALEDSLNPDPLAEKKAQQAIVDAEKEVEDAERDVNFTLSTASQASIDAAEAEVILAKDALDKAREKFEPYENKPEDNLVRANLQSQLAAAQQTYDAKVRELNALLSTGDPLDIALAEANLATAQAELVEAQEEYDQIISGPSPGEIALLESQLEDAEREWERLKDGPDPDDIAAAEAKVAAAEATLAQMKIPAPFDGTVTAIENKPGDQVDPGTIAFRVDDLSRMLVDIEVSEIDINQIELGQSVEMTFDAIFSKVYHGEVVEVASVGTEASGIVNFQVTVELIDADDSVKPGMTAAVDILTTEIADVLVIPNKSVRVVDGQKVVYQVNSSAPLEFIAVPVKLGASSETLSQVLESDLQAGDLILYNPSSDIISEESVFGPGGGNNNPNGFFGGE
jgi:HlyD family secretion protein